MGWLGWLMIWWFAVYCILLFLAGAQKLRR